MSPAWKAASWVVYNPFTDKLYLRRSLFKVSWEHYVVGYL